VQARNPRSPPSALRPVFVLVNVAVYTLQVALWIYLGVTEKRHRANTAQIVVVREAVPPLYSTCHIAQGAGG
jgi:hypothetical protein